MRKSNARYIKASQIEMGDLIRVASQWLDADRVLIGRVTHREHKSYGTEYVTALGIVLHTEFQDGLKKVQITLLDRPGSNIKGMLEGLENVS